MKKNLLFICSGNVARSPTAVDLFRYSKKYSVSSAGTNKDAPRKITQKLLNWADIIFVMSEGTNKHLTFLKNSFDIAGKTIYDLHVKNMYQRNDPRLVILLRKRLRRILKVF